MSEYRNEANELARDTSWTFWRFLPIFLIAVVVLSVTGFGLKSVGLIGSTVVEREVFESSYQRTATLKSKLAQDEAVLASLELQLSNRELDESTANNLRAHAAATRIRIETTRSQLK